LADLVDYDVANAEALQGSVFSLEHRRCRQTARNQTAIGSGAPGRRRRLAGDCFRNVALRALRRDNTPKPTLIRRAYVTEVLADWIAICAHENTEKSSNVVAVAGLIVSLRFPQKCRLTMRPVRRAIHAVNWKRRDVRCVSLPRTVLFGLSCLATIAVGGCATIAPRNVLPQASAGQLELQGFHNIRFWGDAPVRDIQAIMMADAPKTETRGSAVTERHQPFANLLAISGGAEDGAFGAGLLVGWSDAGTRPVFDLVTGVSSGALIAPFAFLGREHDNQLREIFTKYGRKDIFTYNVPGLLEGAALADDAPLARLIEKYIDENFLQEIARERMKGRILLIGTTNLDTQRPVLWDMGRIAMSPDRDAIGLFRKILLASATLPGVFPPVRIQVRVGGQKYDELHVDGGVTRQVFIAPSIFSFVSQAQKSGRSATKQRLYVIRNGKIDPEWQAVNENMLSITQRSISTLIKNQGIGDLYRIYSITKRDGIDFNLASIPADFSDTSDEPFDQKYMIALFNRGYDLASHTYSWMKAPPGLELATQAHN
jgi:predicted acylesterase/phospholipase RssA